MLGHLRRKVVSPQVLAQMESQCLACSLLKLPVSGEGKACAIFNKSSKNQAINSLCFSCCHGTQATSCGCPGKSGSVKTCCHFAVRGWLTLQVWAALLWKISGQACTVLGLQGPWPRELLAATPAASSFQKRCTLPSAENSCSVAAQLTCIG